MIRFIAGKVQTIFHFLLMSSPLRCPALIPVARAKIEKRAQSRLVARMACPHFLQPTALRQSTERWLVASRFSQSIWLQPLVIRRRFGTWALFSRPQCFPHYLHCAAKSFLQNMVSRTGPGLYSCPRVICFSTLATGFMRTSFTCT